jgi:hypothetical protein
MITNSILSAKHVKALKAYSRGSNKQFAEWAAVDTQDAVGLERSTVIQFKQAVIGFYSE